MSVTLRPGTADDAAAVADIWHAGWHVAHPGHVPDGLTERRTLAAFHERSPKRVADTTVAELDGEVAGFIMVVDDEVEQIYVSPAHFGKGVAGTLMAEAERQVAAGGYDVRLAGGRDRQRPGARVLREAGLGQRRRPALRGRGAGRDVRLAVPEVREAGITRWLRCEKQKRLS